MDTPYSQRAGTSPLLAWVWEARPKTSGSYMDLASEFWHVAFLVEHGMTRALLSGPASTSRPISYIGGQYYWGYVFKAHVFMPHLPKKQLLNTVIELPVQGKTFVFGGTTVEMPSFETADAWADELAHKGILIADNHVAKALQGNGRMSKRSLQRHLAESTGLSSVKLKQIERARHAFALLQEGKGLADVAAQSGYTDQAHLTKALKLLAGQTPAQILSDYNPK